MSAGGPAAACRIVPFVPGRRPTEDDIHRGLASSDHAALRLGPDAPAANRAVVLVEYDAGTAGTAGTAVEAVVTLERGGTVLRRRVEDGRIVLRPDVDFAGADLGFAVGFLDRARVDVGGDTTWLDVSDVALLGSLYARVIERLVAPDTARQAATAGVPDPGAAYHPWYPVLTIGVDKAVLYTRALVGDIVHKERHLTDPAWLLRVGVYLELLTCIGIFEAVKDDVGDLLEPDERTCFDTSDTYAAIRERINPGAWQSVWNLRGIAFPRRGIPRTGPVSARNLLNKRRTTLSFLHVHHDDLKHAIALAGANRHNSQETWHRVFRDAERAVLRQTAEAFPELSFLPGPARDVVLWQRWGFDNQHGLYPTACNQYRASMNAVADWAKDRGLMDHAGHECVVPEVSLLRAHMHEPSRVALLQRRDGYSSRLDVTEPAPAPRATTEEVEALLARVPILSMLSPGDVHELAQQARPLLLGPAERLVVQGEQGDSLFLVADGAVEVLVRQDGGEDVAVDTMGVGQVIGEMALLTGEARTATVRAVEGAVVYEIAAPHFHAILALHPEWLDELAAIMEDRLARRELFLSQRDAPIRERIRRRFGL